MPRGDKLLHRNRKTSMLLCMICSRRLRQGERTPRKQKRVDHRMNKVVRSVMTVLEDAVAKVTSSVQRVASTLLAVVLNAAPVQGGLKRELAQEHGVPVRSHSFVDLCPETKSIFSIAIVKRFQTCLEVKDHFVSQLIQDDISCVRSGLARCSSASAVVAIGKSRCADLWQKLPERTG